MTRNAHDDGLYLTLVHTYSEITCLLISNKFEDTLFDFVTIVCASSDNAIREVLQRK